MIRIFGCIAQQHDIRLTLLAVLVCLLGCFTTLGLLSRVRKPDSPLIGWHWLVSAAFVAGLSVWSTHFIAMLAYHTAFVVGYDVALTTLSVALAIMGIFVAFVVSVRLNAPAMGGAIFGAGVAVMHYTGMAALQAPAAFLWDPAYTGASLVIGISFGAAGLWLAARRTSRVGQAAAALALTLAIGGLHFTAMSALTLDPTLTPLTRLSVSALMAPDWLAVAIAVAITLVIALGLSGTAFDQHLTERALRESTQLRLYVKQLETMRIDLQKTNKELELAVSAAAEASQVKSQFLATMSHELRTPLNAIIGFSEILSTEMLGPVGNPRYKAYVTDILGSSRHLLKLVNEILDLAKLEAGRLELNDDLVDICDLVANTVRMIEPLANQSSVRLSHSVPSDLPLVHADERRIQQVLLNLLSNAVKFTPAGGEVQIHASCVEQGLSLRVEDTGIGMSPDQLAIALERRTPHPILLVDQLGRLAGLCGDEEIYRGLLRRQAA